MEKKLYQFGIVVKEPIFRTDLVEAQNHVPTYVLRRYPSRESVLHLKRPKCNAILALS